MVGEGVGDRETVKVGGFKSPWTFSFYLSACQIFFSCGCFATSKHFKVSDLEDLPVFYKALHPQINALKKSNWEIEMSSFSLNGHISILRIQSQQTGTFHRLGCLLLSKPNAAAVQTSARAWPARAVCEGTADWPQPCKQDRSASVENLIFSSKSDIVLKCCQENTAIRSHPNLRKVIASLTILSLPAEWLWSWFSETNTEKTYL